MASPHVSFNKKIKSINWNIVDPVECCNNKMFAQQGGFAYEFCLALCVLCCSELEITFEESPVEDPSVKDDPRDFPIFTPSDAGISFTTSRYGAPLPIVFGSDKLTGNVFWASKIRRHETDINGAKYLYYTADFALGICEGEINGVLRMWLGDKLIIDNTQEVDGDGVAQPNTDGFIFGAAIDLTDATSPLRLADDAIRATRLSVFTGSDRQLPEGVMVAAEGQEEVPGYRGVAYVLFENFIIAESSIPNIAVEVTANTTNLFPRLYGALDDSTFDDINTTMIVVDPSYAMTYVNADSGSAGGFVQFDDLDMTERFQHAQDFSPFWSNSVLLPFSGRLMLISSPANNGTIRVADGTTGAILDTLGPGGNLTSHSLTTGFGGLDVACRAFVDVGTRGVPTDIFCGVGYINRSVAFAEVDDTGRIRMISTINNSLPKDNNQACVMQIDAKAARKYPAFADTGPTEGTHVLIFSWSNNEATQIDVSRVTYTSPTVSPLAPALTTVGAISVGELGGIGFAHSVRDALLDPTDNCVVLQINGSSGRGPWIAKWSPFTGAFKWVTTITSFRGTQVGGLSAFLTGGQYAWIDNAGKVQSISLVDGAPSEVLGSLGAQGLPAITGNRQFYNGYQNALYYIAAGSPDNLVKVFLDRLTRSTVELSDVVTTLIKRTGLIDTDIDVNDLTSLTLRGYTIGQRQTLRTSFAELRQAFTYDIVESNGRILYVARGGSSVETIDHRWLADEGPEGWLQTRQENDAARIRKINLTYRDIDREYGNNVQTVILPKHGNQQFDNDAAIDVTVPIVLNASEAVTLAEILLYAKLVNNTTFVGTLAPRYINLDPSDVITITTDDDDLQMRLREVQIGADNVLKVQASLEDPDIYNDQVGLFGEVGRFEKSEFVTAIPRVDPLLVSIPYRSDAEAASTTTKYLLFYALLPSRDDIELTQKITVTVNGTQRIQIDPPERAPTWGYVMQAPEDTNAIYAPDTESVLRVLIMSEDGAALASALNGLDDLINSSQVNLAYVGGELVQFATATDVGDGVWEFTVLARAKFGTDTMVGAVRAGSRFVLLAGNDGALDELGITKVEMDLGDSPRKVVQFFLNTGNPFQPAPIVAYTAQNLRPWTVANLTLAYDGDDAEIAWNRRTRFDGSDWPDDVVDSVPLNEASEAYELFLFSDPETFVPFNEETYLRKTSVTSPAFTYTLAMQTEDAFDNSTDTLYALIYQTGSLSGQDNGAGVVKSLGPQA